MKKINMGTLKKVAGYLGKLLSVLAIAFIIYAIYKLGLDFSSVTNWPVFILLMIAGVAIKTATVFIMSFGWMGWLKMLAGKKDLDRKRGVKAYVKANIGKYLPGNVMHYVERNLFAADLGISQSRIAIGSVLEIISLVLSAVILAVVMSFRNFVLTLQELFVYNYIKIIFAAACVIVIVAIIMLRKKAMALISEFGYRQFFKTLALALVRYILVLAGLGVIMVMLYAYMGSEALTASAVCTIISGYALAWVLGFLVPGAPGGIGIRELVVTLLLAPVIGEELILTISVIHRLITIIGDFAAYVIGLLLKGSKNEE